MDVFSFPICQLHGASALCLADHGGQARHICHGTLPCRMALPALDHRAAPPSRGFTVTGGMTDVPATSLPLPADRPRCVAAGLIVPLAGA